MEILDFLKSKKGAAIVVSAVSFIIVLFFVFFLIRVKSEEKKILFRASLLEEEKKRKKDVEDNQEASNTIKSNNAKNKEEKSDACSFILLVNKDNPVPSDLKIKTTTIDDVYVDERIAAPLNSMIQAAYDEGMHLGICSGYRDYNFQKMLYENEVARFVASGMSEEDAKRETSENVAEPGKSEHECGLAVDFYAYSDKDANLGEAFENTREGRFAKRVAPEYGFILRYPKGKKSVTKYSYEPWHFRYVGCPLAKTITDSGLTFEEYHEKYLK